MITPDIMPSPDNGSPGNMTPKNFHALRKNLKKDFTGLQTIKLALLGDTSTQLLSQALCGAAFDEGVNLQVFEANFSQVQQLVFKPDSAMYSFAPEIIFIFLSSQTLLEKYNITEPEQRKFLATEEMQLIEQMHHRITANCNATVIFCNYNEIDDGIYGNHANRISSSFLYQLRQLNCRLMEYAETQAGFHICDIASIQNRFGRLELFDPSIYINSGVAFNIEILPAVAQSAISLITSLKGRIKKCIILDLDNTLWGGVIGDDGIENIEIGSFGTGKAFTAFQYWLKKLKERGIILCVCSKNTESIAREVFEVHPDMILRLSDMAIFIANWNNKADNIKHIQKALNIGFDSMVFIDDNQFERNMVRENIPDITVPELPEDPAYYVEYLCSLHLFETTAVSGEDSSRTKLYQAEQQRALLQKNHLKEDLFLCSLNMLAHSESFNTFNAPRVAQLSQRSNQFNLCTVRYTETDISAITSSAEYITLAFRLKDKFGDHGLICAVVLKRKNNKSIFIENLFMSCRVLKRGMEEFVMNEIIKLADDRGFRYLYGEYRPTPKNIIVKDFFSSFGFVQKNNFWKAEIRKYKYRKTFIKKINHHQEKINA